MVTGSPGYCAGSLPRGSLAICIRFAACGLSVHGHKLCHLPWPARVRNLADILWQVPIRAPSPVKL